MKDLNTFHGDDKNHQNAIIITTENPTSGGFYSSSMEKISLHYFEVFDENKKFLGSITGDQLNIAIGRLGFKIVEK